MAIVDAAFGRTWRTTGIGGAGLGVLAFLADLPTGPVGAVVVALTSSGFAWGLAAYVTGFAAGGRRAAVVCATALLLLATVVYYALIVVVSQRWRGATLDDGSSADGYALLSIVRAVVFWAAVSLAVGPVFGLLGDLARRGTPVLARVAAGVAGGALSAQGWYELYRLGGYPDLAIRTAAIIMILLSAVAAFVVVRRAAGPWWVTAAAAVLSAAVGTLAWSLMEAVRISGF